MSARVICGDALTKLRKLGDESVHCCVTSPPYWGLRDYGVQGQIGLEADFRDYIATLVEVFREVRRVLRQDGTLWLNLGDTFAGGGRSGGGGNFAADRANWRVVPQRSGQRAAVNGLKPKDLCGIPWRVAFALQEDGWWLRSDIVWSKPNPMPESVTDRPTKAHEYLFLLTKAERYYYDAEAIRETAVAEEPGAMDGGAQRLPNGSNANAGRNYRVPNSPQSIKSPHCQCFTRRAGHGQSEEDYARLSGRQDALHNPSGRTFGDKGEQAPAEVRSSAGARMGRGAGWRDDPSTTSFTRNKRSVWTVATAPYSEAHFATFPPALIEPCILAGTSEKGVCSKCGAPWVRATERIDKGFDGSKYGETGGSETVGWSPSCACDAAIAPGTVLDPFGGAGTTGLVADRWGRNAILLELNPEYAGMAARRISADAGLFAQVAAE